MTEPLRAAVIGVGMMGQHHVRIYRELGDVQLVGISDPASALATKLSERYGVRNFNNYEQMLDEEKPDLVTIAVPTVAHFDVAQRAISRGIHVLIEKPIADTLANGQALIDLAKRYGVVLAVGHIERHNPAVRALKKCLEEGQLGPIFEIRAERIGPFPARIQDVGVILDLATHDIDVICHLANSRLLRAYAETQQNIHSSREDMLSGLMRFENGVTGILQVNWLTPTKSRRLSVTGARGMYEVDYLTQDLTFYENGDALNFGSLQMLRGVSEGRVIRDKIEKREPLRAEVEDFVGAIRDHREPHVSGHDSLRALTIAQALVQSGQSHEVIEL